MTIIKNIRMLSAEELFALLKADFSPFVNQRLGSAIVAEFAHVADIIDISFPEIISSIAFFITVDRNEIRLASNSINIDINSTELEKQLIDFLEFNLS